MEFARFGVCCKQENPQVTVESPKDSIRALPVLTEYIAKHGSPGQAFEKYNGGHTCHCINVIIIRYRELLYGDCHELCVLRSLREEHVFCLSVERSPR